MPNPVCEITTAHFQRIDYLASAQTDDVWLVKDSAGSTTLFKLLATGGLTAAGIVTATGGLVVGSTTAGATGIAVLGGASVAAVRSTLSLTPGTDVQAYDATLLSIAALGTAADKLAYTTGIDTWAEAAITSTGRSLIAVASASAGRDVLGASSGVFPVASLGTGSPSSTNFLRGDGTWSSISSTWDASTVRSLATNGTLAVQNRNFTAAGTMILAATGTGSNSSGTVIGLNVNPTINQTSTAGYTALQIAVVETAVGSSGGKLLDLYAGAAGTTAEFSVSNAGAVLAAGRITTSKQFVATHQSLADGATITLNADAGPSGEVTIAATGRTLAITNPTAGSTYTVIIIQDGTGSRTITTWPTNTKWAGGSAPALSTAAAAVDIVTFFYNGTNYYAVMQRGFA